MTRARDLAAFVSNADGDIKFDTDTLFIDSSANRVGIGTTTPSRALEISDTSATDVTMRVTNNDGGGELQKNADDLYLNLEDSGDIIVRSGTSITERMRIDSNGRVGIGTASPDSVYKMTIESTASEAGLRVQGDSARIAVWENGSTSVGDGPNFYMQNISGGTYAATMQMGPSSEIIFFNYPNSGSWNERLRIQSGGGISFNGDTAAVNALNDYEEGTWTPVDVSGNAYTSSVQASYTKIGRLVYINFDISSTGSTGGQQISGLPFTAGTGTGNWSMYGGYSTSNQDLWGHINASSNSITMFVGSTAHTLNGRLIGAAMYYA